MAEATTEKRAKNTTPTVPDDPVPGIAEQIYDLATQLADDADSHEAFMDDLLAGIDQPSPDQKPMDQQKGKLAPAKQALAQALAKDESDFLSAQATANGVLQGADAVWKSALKLYNAAQAAATEQLESDTEGFISTYKASIDQTDAPSRQVYLYYNLRQQVAESLQTYMGTANANMTTLLGALATVMEAQGTYRGTVASAGATREESDDDANATYWATVESTLDPSA